MTPTEWITLTLREESCLSIAQIAKRSGLARKTVTRHLSKLLRTGVVRPMPAFSMGRSVYYLADLEEQ